MSKSFDMELFLAGVLTGSHETRRRHVRRAKIIQAEMQSGGSERNHGLGKESTWIGF